MTGLSVSRSTQQIYHGRMRSERFWAAFGDYYAFTKKYWEPPEQFSEEYWDGFEADMKAFIKKHKDLDHRYIEGLTVPLIRRLERIERERRS